MTVLTKKKWAGFLVSNFKKRFLSLHKHKYQVSDRSGIEIFFCISAQPSNILNINVWLIIIVKYSCDNDRELLIIIIIIIIIVIIKTIIIINSEMPPDHNL